MRGSFMVGLAWAGLLLTELVYCKDSDAVFSIWSSSMKPVQYLKGTMCKICPSSGEKAEGTFDFQMYGGCMSRVRCLEEEEAENRAEQ